VWYHKFTYEISQGSDIMSLLHSILLGLVQGVAEFLPISSSGHLAIVEQILGVKGAAEVPGFFDVLLHLGTLAAVFVAYWPEIWEMIQEFFRGISDLIHGTTPTPVPPARRMILLVIVGTLPLFAILGIKDWIESLSSNLYEAGSIDHSSCSCLQLFRWSHPNPDPGQSQDRRHQEYPHGDRPEQSLPGNGGALRHRNYPTDTEGQSVRGGLRWRCLHLDPCCVAEPSVSLLG
jgi:undecaprenyl-diphosphatase